MPSKGLEDSVGQLRNKDVGRRGNPGQFAKSLHATSGITDRADFDSTYTPTAPAPPVMPRRSFTTHTVWGEPVQLRTNDLMDDEVRMVYSSGQCQSLAYALHEKTGWPIVVILDVEAPDLSQVPPRHRPRVIADHLHHAMVRRPDNLLVDIGSARDVRDYLGEIPGGGFEDGDYEGRDTDFLEEEGFHPEDCVCLDQCYPHGGYRVEEVDAEVFWQAFSVGSWPDQNMEAGRHYAELVLRRGDD